ncbi:Hypothetical predicted protein [Olea europaea subsp. europaea]|uniref:Uncharacterized protein n=2 Tax=Olea europaea subsp. europaea TaxID=158383 RepID=A0A8S0S139_OLEEU|nr:Hypothetical predicted protein [Olea europaea subsp. europaea]
MSLSRKTILRKAHKKCARPYLRRNFGLLIWHTGCAMSAHAYLQNKHTLLKFEELDELHAQVEELSPEMEEINDDIDAKWEEIDAKRKVIEAKWEEIGAMHKEIVAKVEARKSRGKEYKDRERRKRRTWMSLLMES